MKSSWIKGLAKMLVPVSDTISVSSKECCCVAVDLDAFDLVKLEKDFVVEVKIRKFWTDYNYFGGFSWMSANFLPTLSLTRAFP